MSADGRSFVFGSVCSGIEAASVAWHPLGWRASFLSEIEPFPRAVLAYHYPSVPLHGDFTTIHAGDYEPIDLLVGGTPCQDFSIAGKREGLGGERGNLTLEFARLAFRLRPKWVVWENVPGVFSNNEGRDFGAVLACFAGYSAGSAFAAPVGGWQNAGAAPAAGPDGYGLAWRVLDAQFAGVPQRRRRVFVVGYLGDWRRAAAVLFERHSLSWNSPPSREAGKGFAVGALAGTSPGGGWRVGADEAAAGHLVAFGGNNTAGPIDVATAVNACASASGRLDFESETFVAHSLRAEGFDASEDGTGRGIPLIPISFDTTQITSKENRSNPQAGDPCHPLASGAHAPAVAFDCKSSGRNGFGIGEVSPTLRSMGHKDSHQNAGGQVAVNGASGVRRLTPRECERLQGFPDYYTLVPFRGKPSADGPRYKALGNSMAVPCMAWIGSRIKAVNAIPHDSKRERQPPLDP